MVKGIDLFAKHFKGFEDSYVLIGGAACDLWMKTKGMPFRSTKDLDIVIIVEALNSDFVKKFWEFVRLANYQAAQKSTGKKVFYRFHKSDKKEYPFMLELFARSPFHIERDGGISLTPIPAGDDSSSLSAILIDEGYYSFVKSRRNRDNEYSLPVIGAEAIIPLKAKAWLDLTARRENGEEIKEKDIKKHRNDVFRLMGTLTADEQITLPESVTSDMKVFLSRMQGLDIEEQKNIAQSISVRTFNKKIAVDRLGGFYKC